MWCPSFLAMSNAINDYIAQNGPGSSFNLVDTTELQVTEGPFSLDFHGIFFPFFSEAFNISMTNTITGEKVTEIGNFIFSGLPVSSNLSSNNASTIDMLIDTVPNPLAPLSTWSGVVAMNATWNGVGWDGNVSGYTHSVSDPVHDKSYQTTITESPAAISFAANTATTPGSFTLAVPTVTGVSVNVQDNAATTTFDSLAITGFSYAADNVSAPQALPAAIAGNDTVSISGAGSLNVMGALVNASSTITALTISDTAANVVANLDYLQTLAAQGKIGSITLTDPGSPALTITTGQQAADTAALLAITSPHSVIVNPPADSGLLGGLSANQQLEMVYIAYFNRAADGVGDTFWVGQNVQAQATGQSASVAVSNIANSFTPQTETIALYPFLGSANLNLNTPAAQAGLTTFINSLYGNMFGHAPDDSGRSYWLGQITGGPVGLGAASLAIANGATGADSIELTNKIAVATDFTTRTIAAGLGQTSPLPMSFIAAAGNVLRGVDGIALNDPSVTLGMAATTTFISLTAPGHQMATGPADPNVIVVTGSDQLIDPGVGSQHDSVPRRRHRQRGRAARGWHGAGDGVQSRDRCSRRQRPAQRRECRPERRWRRFGQLPDRRRSRCRCAYRVRSDRSRVGQHHRRVARTGEHRHRIGYAHRSGSDPHGVNTCRSVHHLIEPGHRHLGWARTAFGQQPARQFWLP